MYTIHSDCEAIFNERNFYLFKHEGLFSVVSRMARTGVLNGYVAVPEGHILYEKEYNSEVKVPDIEAIKFNGNYLGLLCTDGEKAKENIIQLDMALEVHYGLTYSNASLYSIEDGLLGNLWWFGFDTNHSGDLAPYQTDIDRRFNRGLSNGYTYKDFEFVLAETKKLAEQLAKYQ